MITQPTNTIESPLFTKLIEKAEPYFEGINPAHDFNHTQRVLKNAVKISKTEGGDLEVIKVAAILHDVARKIQDDSKGTICHAQKGVEIAEEILKEMMYPEEKIKKVTHCIQTHRFRGNHRPETIEAKIISDADNLDAIGAIGLARTISFAGHIGALVHHPNEAELLAADDYSKLDCAYREYLIKLSKIKGRMLTRTGQEIAEKRHTYMEEFFKRINLEVNEII